MKRGVPHLLTLLALSAIAATNAAGATNEPARDANGFLIIPNPAGAAAGNRERRALGPGDLNPGPGRGPGDTYPGSGAPPVTIPLAAYTLDDKHKLLPGDKVSFQIVEDRTNAIPLLVAESAELDIPYIGRINVSDKTCKDLAAELKTMLEQDYYYRATVIIGLDSLSKVLGKVYVWGPVKQQGPVDIPANENFTAGKAILRQGGFGDFADKRNVKVIRKTATGNVTLKVNMVDVLEKGKTELDIVLQPEDFIIVPQRAINL